MTRPRLGKGLEALIPTANTIAGMGGFKGRKITEISIEKIRPNPMQPRREFDRQKLEGMAETINQYGVIQPIIVVEEEGLYTIVAGERRFRAAVLAGKKTIPAEIRDYSERQYTEIALIENLQREDLNPLEEADAYRKLIEEFKLTQDDVAKRLGKSRSAISNAIRLLALPESIKEDLASGKLTPGQIRPILTMGNQSEQIAYAAKIIDENLTARQVERLVQEQKTGRPQRKKAAKGKEKEDAIIKEMEDNLRKLFGTKVSIRSGIKEGKIEISFYGNKDLDRLLQLLMRY
ncbi:MAG TPA: ParB/RepB/Spo0J family partition protein [Firmicutes bacterium]|nr:ParB/RepB/Spo0J family partition protein [Bacillota bacterium]